MTEASYRASLKRKGYSPSVIETKAKIWTQRQAGASDKEIREKIVTEGKAQAAKEAAYKPEPKPATAPADKYAGVATKITPEMGLPMGPAAKAPVIAKATLKPDPFFSVEGQKARIKNMMLTIPQAVLSQFGLSPDIEAGNAIVKWMANNPLVMAAPGALIATAAKAIMAGTGIALGGSAGVTSLQAINVNTVSAKLVSGNLAKVLSPKTYYFLAAWLGSVALGKWGEAEALEGITFKRDKFWIPEAIRTGDWSLVNEADEAIAELKNPDLIREIASWSPISGVLGSILKSGGIAKGEAIHLKYIDDQKQKQAEGTTEADYWIQRREEEAAQEKENVDYYNAERIKMIEWEHEAEAAARAAEQAEYAAGRETQRAAEIKARNADAAFWAAQEAKQKELEAADRIAIAEFWMAYKKLSQKIADNSRPSNLNFGFI